MDDVGKRNSLSYSIDGWGMNPMGGVSLAPVTNIIISSNVMVMVSSDGNWFVCSVESLPPNSSISSSKRIQNMAVSSSEALLFDPVGENCMENKSSIEFAVFMGGLVQARAG